MNAMHVRVRRSQIAVVFFVVLIASIVPGASGSGFRPEATFSAGTWQSWGQVAWRYFQNCYNPTTGMMDDSCGWHYFTYWGLASNIFGVVDARQLGLITDTDFLNRVNPLLSSLNGIPLDPSTNIPYGVYSRDTLQQATGTPAWDTNPSDYGRYLLAMYVLGQYLTQHGFTTQASQVTSVVNRVNNSYFAGAFGGDLYGYYASLGFMLWGLIPSTTSSVQSSFLNLMQNGPFVASSSMYGVSGIPASTRIDGEPFIDAIVEAGGFSQVTGLSSWNSFVQLGQKVYNAQEARSAALSNTPQFWTGGGLDFGPGFVSEWIVWTTGQTWVTPDLTDARLPVAYLKLMFAYNALYGTAYTSNMLNTYAGSLQAANGFEEGIYANGAFDTNLQIQTQQILLGLAVRATVSPDFTISVNPTYAAVAQGGMATYTVSVTFTGGFSSSVSLSATPSISGATYSFNPSTLNPSVTTSKLTISTTQSAKRDTYTITIAGTGGGTSHSANVLLIVSTPLSTLPALLLNAPANSVYFIFPDGNTAHPKPPGVGYASVTDWTALGFVYGSLTNMPQVVALDTNGNYIDQSTGAPKVSNSVIVLFGGSLVNEVVHYYEANGITPLHWGLVGGFVSGTEYYYDRAGRAVASLPLSAITSNQDMGLIEAFTDQNGNTVIIFSGFGWRGTFVGGVYFKSVLESQLSTMNNSWYVYSWTDSNGNGFPEVSEVNPTPVSYGN